MATEPKAPKGFAGLEDLVSEIDVAPPSPKSQAAGVEPTLPQTGAPAHPASGSVPGWAYGVGLFAIIGVVVLNQLADQRIGKTSTNQVDPYAQPLAPAYQPSPPRPIEIISKTFYKLKGSDGSDFEIEGPPNATPAQLNALGQSHWRPTEEYLPEEKPNVGDGLLLEDNQIRYCMAQKIRMGGWNITVDTYDHQSVVAFNTMVDDLNSRCSHYQYRTGALERVQMQVEARRAQLDVDGRLHHGPRVPSVPPTYKKATSRVATNVIGDPHPRCAGSVEMAKCEALESKLDQETPQQGQARRQKLEDERFRAMAEVNGK